MDTAVYCTNCGAEASADDDFCTTCGHPIRRLDDPEKMRRWPWGVVGLVSVAALVSFSVYTLQGSSETDEVTTATNGTGAAPSVATTMASSTSTTPTTNGSSTTTARADTTPSTAATATTLSPTDPPDPENLVWTLSSARSLQGPNNERYLATNFAATEQVAVIGGRSGSFNEYTPRMWARTASEDWSVAPIAQSSEPGSESQTVSDVVAFKGGFVAVGYAGQWGSLVAAVWTSPDGFEWTRVPHDAHNLGAAEDQLMFDVATDGNTLVATGSITRTDRDVGIWTSDNGVNWVFRTPGDAQFAAPDSQWPNALLFVGDGFMMVGQDGSDLDQEAAVWRSPDGVTWHRVEDDDFSSNASLTINDVAVTDSGFVAVGFERTDPDFSAGATNGIVWTSVDGNSWIRVESDVFGGAERQELYRVLQTPSGLVATGTDWSSGAGSVAMWSLTSTAEWHRLELGDVFKADHTRWLHDLAVWNGTIIAVGSDGEDDRALVWTAPLG